MKSLPIMSTDVQPLALMQTSWANALNPILTNPLVAGELLTGVALSSGANVVNHKLGRKLQGWVLTRVRANATVYDTQDLNARSQLTLLLTSSAAVIVDLYVF